MVEFRDLGLSDDTLRGLATMGFEAPTPVQEQAIPCLLEGRDVIAQALTGTGKTAAFGVPLVERIDPARAQPQAIVLTPTRELAIQVTDHLCKIGQYRRIAVLPIYGGQPIGRQLDTLRRGVHAIVATPGRLLDHMRRGSIDLSGVRTLILDEADQMLEMGFIEDVEYVLEQLPAERVTALFSATMPKPIVDLAGKHLRDPEMIRLSRPQGLITPDIEQVFYLVPFPRKLDALCRVLDVRQPERAIVFCATKRMVDEVVAGLTARGYPAEALHGDISQVMRERVLRSFRAGQFEVLVATDVAARGLDVPEVSHVVNFDIPPDPEYYVHRIGRTGRYGRARRSDHVREPARDAGAEGDRAGDRRPHPPRRGPHRRRGRGARGRDARSAPPGDARQGRLGQVPAGHRGVAAGRPRPGGSRRRRAGAAGEQRGRQPTRRPRAEPDPGRRCPPHSPRAR